MNLILHKHQIEWRFKTEQLPTAYAHVLEHLLCRLLVTYFDAVRVEGKTTNQHVRLQWAGRQILTAESILGALAIYMDPEVLDQELSAISVELGWLSPNFHDPDPLQVSITSLSPMLSALITTLEVVDRVETSSDLWLGLSKHYLRYVQEISRFQKENHLRYPKKTAFQHTQGLILCRALERFEGLALTILKPIHLWYWVLKTLSQYASSLTQRLRNSGENFYSYGFGVFPYCGSWYLYLTGLHKTTLTAFLFHFLTELDAVLGSEGELEKLHRELETELVLELNDLFTIPKSISRMLMNSTFDFKNFIPPPAETLVPVDTSTKLISPHTLNRVLADIRREIANALEEAKYV
jgi:hypothetical protein